MRYVVHNFQEWKTNKKGDEIAATLEKLLSRREIDTELTTVLELERYIDRYVERMNDKYPRTNPLRARTYREGGRLWISVEPVRQNGRAFGRDAVCCAQAVMIRDRLCLDELRTAGAEAKPGGEALGMVETN